MGQLWFDCRLQYPSGFHLNAAFEAGNGITALFGPSGSGKSTIFGLIAGIQRPDSGSIRLRDRVLVDTQAHLFLLPEQRRVGVVFQDHLLFPHLTVEENLRFGLGRGSAQSIDFDRVMHILEIGDLLKRSPRTLSGGQQQRVALGRALLRGPEMLLMDEPLTGLDESLKERILSYLERAVAEWRIPTLLVSHDQADVRRLADQVVVLEAGKVIDSGPTGPTLDGAVLTRLSYRPGPVNLLRVSDLQRIEDHWEGTIGEQRLHLPAAAGAKMGSSIHVQFLPRDVALGVDSVSGISVRNRLQGRVRELVTLPDRTFVAIDVGQFLWAEVTPEAVRELDLHPGRPVICLIKTSAIQLLE